MTVTDQINILDKKTMQKEAQYDLDRKAAKISALPPNNLDKYEYLTGQVLGYKPSVVKQAKFEDSRLGKIFTKGLDKDDQKEGLFKRQKLLKTLKRNYIILIILHLDHEIVNMMKMKMKKEMKKLSAIFIKVILRI